MDTQQAKAYILAKLKNELPPDRTYHSFEHTLDVYASAISIAEAEGLSGEELELLKTAALYHDAGFLLQGQDHEEAGCRMVRELLPGFGYSAVQVERICAMIMATRIPQAPADQASKILCDADLDYLGRDDFEAIGELLFEEMKAYGMLRTEVEWNNLQVRFLDQHGYFTATNMQLREPGKQAHLARLRDWLANSGQ